MNSMYSVAIVDEIGTVKYWCKDMSDEDIHLILRAHPEWSMSLIEKEN